MDSVLFRAAILGRFNDFNVKGEKTVNSSFNNFNVKTVFEFWVFQRETHLTTLM